jgi:hypothetical protein
VIPDSSVQWFDNTLGWLKDNDFDFAFWPLVGYLQNGQGNGWALVSWDTNTGQRDGLFDGNDWRADRWRDFINSTTPQKVTISNSTNYRMINIDYGDYIKSETLASRGDWDSGARKGACPDSLRLIGLSQTNVRGLCTDDVYGTDLWNSAKDTVTVTDDRYNSADWARKYIKLECPPNHYVIGYSIRGKRMSSIVCAASDRPGGLGMNGRTMWFNRADSRDSNVGGDFALSEYKGQCGGNEYIGGVAFTTRGNPGQPAAIFCKS